ncbi:MAG: HAD family hydrolase [Dehalococcoidales bacterium]|nr:HAD family hydrolase [Dehalococcoidales bacterium]
MKAVFLDRDGVINELIYYEEAGVIDSPFTVEQFRLFSSTGKAIRRLNDAGFMVIVVSNQPGVAKNHFNLATLEQMNGKMAREISADGAHIDRVYYCPHHPEGQNPAYRMVCKCRKPEPGMLLQGIGDFKLNPEECYMVGDNLTDIQAGQRAGCKTILLGKQKCELCQLMDELDAHPDRITKNLPEAVEAILEMERQNGNIH